MRIGIATDHGGFGLKEDLRRRLAAAGHDVVEFGAFKLDPGDDYPDFVLPLARAVVAGQVERGVAVCGSGVGATVCANKVPGVRACLITDHFGREAKAGTSRQESILGLGQTVSCRRLSVRCTRHNRPLQPFHVPIAGEFTRQPVEQLGMRWPLPL